MTTIVTFHHVVTFPCPMPRIPYPSSTWPVTECLVNAPSLVLWMIYVCTSPFLWTEFFYSFPSFFKSYVISKVLRKSTIADIMLTWISRWTWTVCTYFFSLMNLKRVLLPLLVLCWLFVPCRYVAIMNSIFSAQRSMVCFLFSVFIYKCILINQHVIK